MNKTFDPWGDPATREHDSIQLNLAVCAVLTWLISAVFVGLRVYTRRFLLKVFGWEDTCIILSLIFAGAMTAGALDQIVHGSGKHAWDIPAGNYTPLARANWYTVLFYFLSLAFCKLSILFLYHGIFTYQSVHIAVYVVAAIVIVTNVWNVIATLTACIPLRAYWDVRAMPGARCWDASVWWTNLSLHMGTDWLIFLMPLPVIWRLTVPRRQKFILVGVFALGFFVCFVSVFRLVSLIQAQKEMSRDSSYHNANLGYWTSVEVSFAIVCACLMTLKPLVSRFFPSFFSPTPVHSVHSQGGSTTAGGGASSTRQMRLRSKFSSPLDSPLYGGRGGLRREFGRPHHYNEQSAQERGLESWFDDDDARLSQDDGSRGARHSRRMSIEEIPMDGRDTDRSREEAAAAHFRDGVDSPSDTIPRASLRPPPPVVRTQSRDGPGGTFLASLSDAGGRSPSVLPPPSPAGSVGGSTFGGSKAEFYDSSSEKTSQEFGTVTSTTATTTTPAEAFGRQR